MSTLRLKQFEEHISRARSLVGLGQSISGMTFEQVDASDMYRVALVQAVAALDAYVHGVVLDFGVDIILGRRQQGSEGKLGLHIGAISDIANAANTVDREIYARTHVASRISRETYQRPDDIGYAFALVGMPQLWKTVFGDRSGTERTALGLVVARRNQIVHACDSDPLSPWLVTALSDNDALSAINQVDRIVRAIDAAT